MYAGEHLIYLSDKEKLALTKSSNSWIFKVPRKLRVAGGDRYDPHVVSIGPYHRTAENLEVTTNLKKYYVRRFMEIRPTPTEFLNSLIDKIKERQATYRGCYAYSVELDDDGFCDMILLDACFIIGVLRRCHLARDDPWRRDDILFNNNSILSSIRRDLILLENQIPYDALQDLFQMILPSENLKDYIMKFFAPILPATIATNCEIRGEHILHFLYKHLISVPAQGPGTSRQWEHTICATDLEEAGVKFRSKNPNTGLLDISFDFQTGKFEIPPFSFGESWTVLFPNMIALEQCHEECEDRITSYVLLMDNLVDSRSDVKLFKDEGILTRSFKEYETIANDINHLSKEALYNTFYYDQICENVNKFHKRRWPTWRASFMRNYIRTPWALFSAIAAFLLLLLALAQTMVSILAWRYPVQTT